MAAHALCIPYNKTLHVIDSCYDSVYQAALMIMGVAKLGLCHVDTAHTYYNQNHQQAHSNRESILQFNFCMFSNILVWGIYIMTVTGGP